MARRVLFSFELTDELQLPLSYPGPLSKHPSDQILTGPANF